MGAVAIYGGCSNNTIRLGRLQRVGGNGNGGIGKTDWIIMELRWVSSRRRGRGRGTAAPTPVYISTNPSDVNPDELLRLYGCCNHSCHRFPLQPQPQQPLDLDIDIHKLHLALSHSSIVVSIFGRVPDDDDDDDFITKSKSSSSSSSSSENQNQNQFRDLLQRAMPVTPFNSNLVGFGRAVSDLGLTASIYDVMVMPSLRRMGIGRMIVQRIVRMLTSKDIYDISALCSENERFFFKACGFGDDILASTTMMYTKTASTCPEDDQMVKRAGRKLLIVPPLRNFTSSKTIES